MIDFKERAFAIFVRQNRLNSDTAERLSLYLQSNNLTAVSCFIVDNKVFVEHAKGQYFGLDGKQDLFAQKPEENRLLKQIQQRERLERQHKRWLLAQPGRSIDGKCPPEILERRLKSKKAQIQVQRQRRLIITK